MLVEEFLRCQHELDLPFSLSLYPHSPVKKKEKKVVNRKVQENAVAIYCFYCLGYFACTVHIYIYI